MGLFSKIFGDSTEEKQEKVLPWLVLNDVEQLDAIEEKSLNKAQIIFKHSTRCGISRMVKNQFEADYELEEKAVDLYYLDLLNYRNVSNEIANKFSILHESPQLLIIKNKAVVKHESHGAINAIDLNNFI